MRAGKAPDAARSDLRWDYTFWRVKAVSNSWGRTSGFLTRPPGG